MFTSRIEDYWITRPDTLNLGYIKDLNHLLTRYDRFIAYQPCKHLPEFGILQLSKDDAVTILDALKDNSLINDYIKLNIQYYIDDTPLSFADYKNQQNYLDLQSADYKAFITFITHPNISIKRQSDYESGSFKKHPAKNWIDGDLNKLLAFYEQLFKQSDKLWQDYSVNHLDAMLQFVLNDYAYGLDKLVYDSRLSFEKRQAVIESIYELYAKLFIHDPIEYHRHMLWDGLAFSYTHGTGSFGYYFDKSDIVPLQNVMFKTLTKILEIPCEACQNGALHGLNHLRYPDTAVVIRRYLASHPDLDEDDIAYVEACIIGDMM